MKRLHLHMCAVTLSLLLLMLAAAVAAGTATVNITKTLERYEEFRNFNSLLSETKLADEINERQAVTILVLNNDATQALVSRGIPRGVLKNLLRVHVLLDFWDPQKFRNLAADVAVTTTTLFQTTGNAPAMTGFINITSHAGTVSFQSAAPESKSPPVTLLKAVEDDPYNSSVLQISGAIVPPGVVPSAPAPPFNLTAALYSTGHAAFAKLLVDTGVIGHFNAAVQSGLTVFAPVEGAFNDYAIRPYMALAKVKQLEVLQYHGIASYLPLPTLRSLTGQLATLAAPLTVHVYVNGDTVTLDSGVMTLPVTGTSMDNPPVAILSIPKIILTRDAIAPAPAPAFSDSKEFDDDDEPAGPGSPPPADGAPVSEPPVPADAAKLPPKIAPSPSGAGDASHDEGPDDSSASSVCVALSLSFSSLFLMLLF